MALVETGGSAPAVAIWHMQRDGTPFGPYTDIQFRQMMTSGQLLGTDLVWREGMPEWATLAALYPNYFPSEVSDDAMAFASAPVSTTSTSPYSQPRPRPAKRSKSNFGVIASIIVGIVVVPVLIFAVYRVVARQEQPKPAAPPPLAKPATNRSIFSET